MRLDGSCFCGKVTFSVESRTPYPYRTCYCTRCRKTGGGSGAAIGVMGEAASLEVRGEEHLVAFVAKSNPPGPGIAPVELRMSFCKHCGSHLFIISPSPGWSEHVYPWASAIDTPLPKPPERFHINLEQAVEWIEIPEGAGHLHFAANTPESIEDWHRRHGLYEE